MTLIREQDFGTPAKPGPATVHVQVDGRDVTVPEGTSIMRAAATAGIDVPKLCATDSLGAFGSCRLCLVEVDGRRGTPASCTTPCSDGMSVKTRSRQAGSPAQRGHGAVLQRPSAGLPDGEQPGVVRTPRHGRRPSGMTDVRYGQPETSHQDAAKDISNPYFAFDPAKCIVCSRCVRACDEVQGTFALTIAGRGFDSRVSAGQDEPFLESECVSCGACVQACPTDALQEKTLIQLGPPNRSVLTTCAYCGVGCSFKAEMQGDTVVNMVPYKNGGANEGHSCVKGRFAWGYANHEDRVLQADGPRDDRGSVARGELGRGDRLHRARASRRSPRSTAPARSVASPRRAARTKRSTSSRRWSARPSARTTWTPAPGSATRRPATASRRRSGPPPGTQDFASVEHADVIMVIGANPTDGHPVFASRMKRRLRQGAKLIVIDPRRIDLVRSPHIEASHHLQLLPGTNVAVINAMAHVIVTEGLMDQAFVDERCEDVAEWAEFIARPENSPEAMEPITGVPAAELRAAARLYATAPNAAIYYGLGVTEHSQGSTMVMGMANLAMATGNIGREGVGVSPLRGQNNVQGSCDMGSFPHELSGYRHVSDPTVRELFADLWGAPIHPEPGLRIPNMLELGDRRRRSAACSSRARTSPSPTRTPSTSRPRCMAMDLVVVQDLFLNETAKYAHVFLPGTSFLEKNGTFTNAERRINRVRPVMKAATGKQEWEVVVEIAARDGLRHGLRRRVRDHGRDRRAHADVRGRVVQEARRARQHPVAVQRRRPRRARGRCTSTVRPRQGPLRPDGLRRHRRADEPQVPAAAHDRPDPVAVQRRRADAPHQEQHVAPGGRPGHPSERCRDARDPRRRLGVAREPRRRDHAARRTCPSGCRRASSTRRSTTR